MLQIFRNNQFFVVIPLALYLLVLHGGALLGIISPVPHPEDGGRLYRDLLGWTAQMPLTSALLGSAFVLIQAIFVNFLADQFRLLGERNWYPGLFYVLAAGCLPEFLFVSPPLVAVTFIPPVLWSIYKAYQKPLVHMAIFDAGLWLSVGSLFYAPLIWLSIAAFAGIGLVRVFRLNERFIFFSGIAAPQFLAWLWYFWADKGAEFRDTQSDAMFQWYRFDAQFDEATLFKAGLLVILAVVFLLGLGSAFNRKVIQIQKFISVLNWFLVLGAFSCLFRADWRWEHLLLSAASMGLLLALTFQNLRKGMWPEIYHLTLLVLILLVQYWEQFSGLLPL